MGCRNALLPDNLVKERSIKCLTCNQNTGDNSSFSNP